MSKKEMKKWGEAITLYIEQKKRKIWEVEKWLKTYTKLLQTSS